MSTAVAQKIEAQQTYSQPIVMPSLSIRLPNNIGFKIGQLVLTAAFIGMFVAAVHPDIRAMVRGSVLKDFRNVVSTATGDLRGDGTQLTVVKVKTRATLSLEIYDTLKDGSSKLIQKIPLEDSKDGYFNFNGSSTNLAIDDFDGNGRAEILAPTFDQNLVGHLSVYRYNSQAQTFQRIVN